MNLSHWIKAFELVIACCSGRDGVHGAAGEVGYVERLLDVKLAGFAVAVDAVPIEESIRGVAGLLDFGDQEAGTECVHGAGFDQDAIADARFELMKADFAVAASQLALERLPVDARFQAGVDFASRFGGQHDPGFGFSEIGRIEFCALLVVGMNLHRESLMAVEEFQEQAEIGRADDGGRRVHGRLALRARATFCRRAVHRRPCFDRRRGRRLPSFRRSGGRCRSVCRGRFRGGGRPTRYSRRIGLNRNSGSVRGSEGLGARDLGLGNAVLAYDPVPSLIRLSYDRLYRPVFLSPGLPCPQSPSPLISPCIANTTKICSKARR